MKVIKRTRAISRSKLRKGQTAKGDEYYYSKKPHGRRADYVDSKTRLKPLPAQEPSATAKKK